MTALQGRAAGMGPARAGTGRIGPNAITRVAEVLPALVGFGMTSHLFHAAGLAHYLARPPESMVDEAEVMRLHHVLRDTLGSTAAQSVAHAAGRRTADYLLAHRIPRPVQWLLHALPAALAARVLLQAIRRHAWTFSGSGVFSAHCGRQPGRQVALVIQHNPLCRGVVSTTPTCAFYRATFEHLFKVLVHPDAEVTETACESRGDPACRFNVGW